MFTVKVLFVYHFVTKDNIIYAIKSEVKHNRMTKLEIHKVLLWEKPSKYSYPKYAAAGANWSCNRETKGQRNWFLIVVQTRKLPHRTLRCSEKSSSWLWWKSHFAVRFWWLWFILILVTLGWCLLKVDYIPFSRIGTLAEHIL